MDVTTIIASVPWTTKLDTQHTIKIPKKAPRPEMAFSRGLVELDSKPRIDLDTDRARKARMESFMFGINRFV